LFRLSKIELAILSILWHKYNLTATELINDLDFKEKRINKAIAKLLKKGLIKVIDHKTKGQEDKATEVYTFVYPFYELVEQKMMNLSIREVYNNSIFVHKMVNRRNETISDEDLNNAMEEINKQLEKYDKM